MNCIPATRKSASQPGICAHRPRGRWLSAVALVVIAGCSLTTSIDATADDDAGYRMSYTVAPQPDDEGASVELVLDQERHLLREMSMRMPDSRFRNIHGDGEVSVEGNRVTWLPPPGGGKLTWFVTLRHKRSGDSYDAYIDDDWALFRASDVIPPARTRTLRGAVSRTSIAFDLPSGWSSATQYHGRNHRYLVENAERRYARPSGWILLGSIGTRIERIAGVQVKIAGPTGQSVRRLDMLALMQWTLPHLARLLPQLPARLTIFSAAGPMWRGGLSGPDSLFLHADLPLISENGTSTLVHEIMHVVTGLVAEDGADWIVEGLAEYYGLELLRRSRTISNDRFRDALGDLRDWGKNVKALCDGPSTGEVTARAVGVMAELDDELRTGSGGRVGLDQVLRELVASGSRVSVDGMRQTVRDLNGGRAAALSAERLPGCD